MNNENELNEKNILSSVTTQSEKPMAFDSAFPSLKLLGVGVGVVVILLIVSGWKIVNLEIEKASLNAQRVAFKEKLSLHIKTLEALPVLTQQRNDLNNNLGDLRGKINAEKDKYEPKVTPDKTISQIISNYYHISQTKSKIKETPINREMFPTIC